MGSLFISWSFWVMAVAYCLRESRVPERILIQFEFDQGGGRTRVARTRERAFQKSAQDFVKHFPLAPPPLPYPNRYKLMKYTSKRGEKRGAYSKGMKRKVKPNKVKKAKGKVQVQLSGPWSGSEKRLFDQAWEMHKGKGRGVKWASIAKVVGGRTVEQCRTHWQKRQIKAEREFAAAAAEIPSVSIIGERLPLIDPRIIPVVLFNLVCHIAAGPTAALF